MEFDTDEKEVAVEVEVEEEEVEEEEEESKEFEVCCSSRSIMHSVVSFDKIAVRVQRYMI